jgi:hypothetical protein
MWDVGCGVWGVGCGVWGVGCGVWGVGCGVTKLLKDDRRPLVMCRKAISRVAICRCRCRWPTQAARASAAHRGNVLFYEQDLPGPPMRYDPGRE